MALDVTNIFGSYDSRDLASEGITTLSQYTEQNAMRDIQRFLDEYNAIAQQLESELAIVDTIAQAKFGESTGGEMQPYTEAGETMATRTGEDWTIGFPIYRYRGRKMYTQERLLTIPLDKLNRDINDEAKKNWTTRMKALLRAAMFKTNFTFTDGIFPGSELGSLAVKRFCNADSGDGSVDVDGVKVAIAALQHYFGSNNATMTITPFKTAYAKLKTVGKVADVVVRVNSADADTIAGFSEWYPANNARIIDPNKVYAVVQSPRAIGRLEGAGISVEVIVQPFMPSGYFLMYDRADRKPLVKRVHTLAQMRGLRMVQNETGADYGAQSLRNKVFEDIFGYGVYNRPNGTCCQIVASTTYTDPTL